MNKMVLPCESITVTDNNNVVLAIIYGKDNVVEKDGIHVIFENNENKDKEV